MLRASLVTRVSAAVSASLLLPVSALAQTQEGPTDIEQALAADEKQSSNAAAGAGTNAGAPATPGLMNPDIALILDVAGAYFSDADPLQSGGHDPSETGFNLQQLELSLGSAVDPYFRLDSNIVFALDGVEVEEAYGTTLELPLGLQARAGQFLTRFGRLNSTHPHSWDFVDQPFALGRVFGPEGNRGLGVELSWLSPLPWYVELVGSVTGAAGEGTTRSFYGEDDPGVSDPADLLYVTAIKQFFPLSEDWSAFWGVSGAFGPNSSGERNRSAVYGTDLYLKYRPITRQSFSIVSLQSEAFYRRRQVPGSLLQDVSLYSQLFWRFAQRWGSALRYEYGSPEADAAARVPAASEHVLDPEWTRARHRVSANVTFWPSEFSRLRLQGSVDDPRWRSQPIWATFLALELVAGAHGSHGF